MADMGFWAGFGLGMAAMACYWYFVVDQPQVRRWSGMRKAYEDLLEAYEAQLGLQRGHRP